MLSNFRKLMQHSLPDLALLAQTFFLLGIMRAAITFFLFQTVARWLGFKSGEIAPPVLETHIAYIKRIEWAVNAAAIRTPWESTCLVQSLTGALLLRYKKISGSLYLGVVRDGPDKNFSAHSWLCCGETIITGSAGHERFHPIATFVTY